MDKIYTVMVSTECRIGNLGWPDWGDARVMGWFCSYGAAERAVKKNLADIHENYYNYAVIEKTEQGFYPRCFDRWFYKWDKDQGCYVPMEEPVGMGHFCNFIWG